MRQGELNGYKMLRRSPAPCLLRAVESTPEPPQRQSHTQGNSGHGIMACISAQINLEKSWDCDAHAERPLISCFSSELKSTFSPLTSPSKTRPMVSPLAASNFELCLHLPLKSHFSSTHFLHQAPTQETPVLVSSQGLSYVWL